MAFAVAIPLIGWSAIALVSDNDDPSVAPASETPGDSTSSAPTDDTTTPAGTGDEDAGSEEEEPSTQAQAAIDVCAAKLTAGKAVVTEAKTGVGHWSEHIQARTDLLNGEHARADADAIWKRTRLAGPDDLERFDAVMTTYEQLPGCDELAETDPPEELQDTTDACLERADFITAAISASTDAMTDWEHHLADMAEHADGGMDAEEAQENWVEAWENGPTNINAFNDARDELEQAPECSGADE